MAVSEFQSGLVLRESVRSSRLLLRVAPEFRVRFLTVKVCSEFKTCSGPSVLGLGQTRVSGSKTGLDEGIFR